jgi:hypothetical protein
MGIDGKHILCLWKENAFLMSCVLNRNSQIGFDADGQFGQVHRIVEFVGAKADSFKFLDCSRCFNQAVLTLKWAIYEEAV